MTGLYTTPAFADDPSATETAAARSLAVDGLKLAQSGDCAGAIPKLERAEKLHHAPVVASRLGECYVSIGRLVEGTEVLRKVLREPAPADATPAYSKAMERAQHALDVAKPRIAGLTVKVAAVQDMVIKVDGNAVPGALVDAEIPADPGEHSVEVGAPGFLKSATRVRVGDGEKKTVTLTLTRDPAAATAPAASGTTPPPAASASGPAASSPDQHSASRTPSAPPARRSPNHTAAYVSLTLGTAGLVTGGVLGLVAMKRYKTLQAACPGNVCPPEKEQSLASAKQLGNFSNIAFGVGATGVVLGTVLYFTVGGGESDHAKASQPARFAGISGARVAVGAGQVELSGEF